jgi:predicted carbohydrate-binding protein with CBM5 and CBM33 domain
MGIHRTSSRNGKICSAIDLRRDILDNGPPFQM